MIKSVTAINYLGEALTIDPRVVGVDGFQFRGIEGLTPVKGTINQSKVSTMPGVKTNSTTVDGRNIVLTLGLLPATTVEETRQRSYRYFPVTHEVTLIIETDRRIVVTTGRVESNEPPIMGKETFTQISILCDDAYLYDASANSKVTASFYAVEGGFEFPFSNESLTEPLLEFGSIVGITDRVVHYNGDAETGVTITINAVGPVEGLIVYNPDTNEAVRIDHDILEAMVGTGISAGDKIVVTTDRGNKTATLYRGGLQYNILNALGRNVNWLKLRKGDNTLAYTATVGEAEVQVSIESLILYEGV